MANRHHNTSGHAKKWIAKAHLKEGALTAKAHKAGEGVQEFAHEHASDPGKTGKQARLAITFKKMSH